MPRKKTNVYQAAINKYLVDEGSGGSAGTTGPGRIVKTATPITATGTKPTRATGTKAGAHGLVSRRTNVSGAGKPIERGAVVAPVNRKKKTKRNG